MKLLNLPVMFLTGFLATCGSPAPSQAQERPLTLGVHTVSYHVNKIDPISHNKWNNANPGLYVKWDNVVVGGYYNSIRKPSFYVAYAYPLTGNIDLTVGAITGYGDIHVGTNGYYGGYKIMPLVSPSFHFPITDKVEGRVHYTPKAGKYSTHAVHFSIEFSL